MQGWVLLLVDKAMFAELIMNLRHYLHDLVSHLLDRTDLLLATLVLIECLNGTAYELDEYDAIAVGRVFHQELAVCSQLVL